MKENFRRMFRNVNPAILIIILVLLVNNMLSSHRSLSDWLMMQLLSLPGILIGLTFHEAAHGFVSYWLGDPTPKLQGRLSLNPLRHIDPIGFLALFFAGFGWGEPVQINPSYYKHRRIDELLVSLAGVVTNFIIAALSAAGLRLIFQATYGFMSGGMEILFYILEYMMTINLVLMVFNLLPVPPLDGFGIITQIFRLDRYSWYYPLYRNGFYILMVLIIFNVTSRILTPAVLFFADLLL